MCASLSVSVNVLCVRCNCHSLSLCVCVLQSLCVCVCCLFAGNEFPYVRKDLSLDLDAAPNTLAISHVSGSEGPLVAVGGRKSEDGQMDK